jgi:membrane protein YdbS with pleckstrin-like domain
MTPQADKAAVWIYEGLWAVLVQWFRVPKEPPTLPIASGDRVESFRPAPGFLSYLKLWFWIVLLLIDLAIFIGWIAVTVALWWLGLILAIPALFIAVVPDIFAYVALHLRYDTTWYVMTDRSLRIRRGVWSIHETTITFENVQNVKVHSGPIQRAFGIANIVVETAGAGGQAQGKETGGANRGIIEGVSNAPELRDMIMRRLRESRTAGLGDEDDFEHAPRAAAWTPDHLAALRDIRDEVKRCTAALPGA